MRAITLLKTLAVVQGVLFFPVFSAGIAYAAPDCKSEDLNQSELNECADQDFLTADKNLNAIYKKAKEVIQDWDDDTGAAMKAFVAGQKGWISYRDGYCTAYAYQSHGGSMEPMLLSGCMASVTNARTEELKTMVEDSGN